MKKLTGKLLIRLFNHHHLEWLACNAQGEIEHAAEKLIDQEAGKLKEFASGREIIVILPSCDVLLMTTELPAMKRQQLLEALPFTFEEQLIEEVEYYFFAAPSHKNKGPLTAAVLTHQVMQQYLTRLQMLAIQPDIIIPEVYALPFVEKTWHIYLENQQALLRLNKYQGCIVDITNLNFLLENYLQDEESEKPTTILLENFPADSSFSEELSLKITATTLTISVQKINQGSPIIQHAIKASDEIAINLLQGKYRVASDLNYKEWVWPVATYLAGALIVIYLASQLFALGYLQIRESLLQHQIAVIYQQYFPDGKTIANPELSLQEKIQELQKAQSGGDFLQLLAKVGTVIHSYPPVIIKNMQYTQQQLQVDLQVADTNTGQNLISALKNLRLTVQQQQNGDLLHLQIGEGV